MNELQSLIVRLKEANKNCEDKCVDLQSMKFEAKEGLMKLYDQSREYYFKSDPKNPKDPKVIHAAKQFTKLAGIPYSFFIKNPEYMRNQMIECWLPTLKPEKAQILAKLRKTVDGYTLRAVLPVEYTNISNAEVMEALSEVAGDSFKIEFVIGDDKDDPILHVRFISKDSFEACKETCYTGFSVIASELGASPIAVETMLFRDSSKASMIASYSGEGYFSSNYEGIQANSLKELFPKLINCLKTQLPELKDKIQSAKEVVEKREDISELMQGLRMRKGLSDKFHTLLFQEIEKDKSVKTRWDFVNKVSILAKDFDVMSRVRIEKAAGDLVGLSFEKS